MRSPSNRGIHHDRDPWSFTTAPDRRRTKTLSCSPTRSRSSSRPCRAPASGGEPSSPHVYPSSRRSPFCRDLDADSPSAAAWSTALTLGLGLIARGRLYPSVTASGWDAWHAGPLDPADRRLLARARRRVSPGSPCVAARPLVPPAAPLTREPDPGGLGRPGRHAAAHCCRAHRLRWPCNVAKGRRAQEPSRPSPQGRGWRSPPLSRLGRRPAALAGRRGRWVRR